MCCAGEPKRAHFIPTVTTITAEGSARLYLNHIWKHHGLPDQFVSDRGPQFASAFARDLYKLLGVEVNPSTAYHPQTDGQTERKNAEIEKYLRMWINARRTTGQTGSPWPSLQSTTVLPARWA